MARGPKKHLKRLNAPKHWMLAKLGGIFAPRPSTGPHKMRECLPLTLILRNRLKYALTRREVQMILMRRKVAVDGKTRTDASYPAGFMDVISIPETAEDFRLLYDVKGRFTLHRVPPEEAKYKLCRVQKVAKGNKASIGHNRFANGQLRSIPYVVTHDGRTVKYPDPDIKTNDTIKFDLATGTIASFIKFKLGAMGMVIRGKNCGRVGYIAKIEKHPGTYDMVHLEDKRGHIFATRMENVFVIGEKKGAWISLPRGKGIKLTITEERDRAEKQAAKKNRA